MRDVHPFHIGDSDGQRGFADKGFLALATLVGVVGVTAIFVWFVSLNSSSAGSVPSQNPVPVTQLSQSSIELAQQFRPFTGVVPVLSYTGVSADGEGPLLSPIEFQLQMMMLDTAGFTTVTVEQVRALALRKEVDLPDNPVLITFDGAGVGLWTDADPILAEHGFSAEVFLTSEEAVTDSDPQLLNKDTLRAMKASGRWGFGAHVDAVTLERPPGESLLVWEGRVRDALSAARVDVGAAVDVNVISMSYPYSDGGLPQGDRAVAARLPQLVGEQFDLGFLDMSSSAVVSETIDKTMAPRLPQTLTTLSPSALLGAIEEIIPRPPVGAVDSLSWSVIGDGSCIYSDSTLVISAEGTTTCTLESAVRDSWDDVVFSGILNGVSSATTAAIQLRVAALQRIEVSFLPDVVVVQRQVDGVWTPVARESLTPAESIGPQPVMIELRGSLIVVTVAGRQVVIAEVGLSTGTGRVNFAAVGDQAGVITITQLSVAVPSGT